jgi:hypothetical protein
VYKQFGDPSAKLFKSDEERDLLTRIPTYDPSEDKVIVEENLSDSILDVKSCKLFLFRCHLEGKVSVNRYGDDTKVIFINCTWRKDRSTTMDPEGVMWISLLGRPPQGTHAWKNCYIKSLLFSETTWIWSGSICDTSFENCHEVYLDSPILSRVEMSPGTTVYVCEDQKTICTDVEGTVKTLSRKKWSKRFRESQRVRDEVLYRDRVIKTLRRKFCPDLEPGTELEVLCL